MAARFKILGLLFCHSPIKRMTKSLGNSHLFVPSFLHIRCCSNLKSNGKVNHFNPDEKEDEDVELRLNILDAAIQFVPEYGWSRKALAAGAESLGLPGVAHGMLGGGEELVMNFIYHSNRKLEKILDEKYGDIEHSQKLDIYFHDALKTRLEMITPVVNRWSEALAILLQPKCVPEDLELLLDLSMVVWDHTADRNVYMKWYTKRLSLMLAYRLSELYMTQDSSTDYAATWDFLKSRIDEVIATDMAIEKTEKNIFELTNAVGGMFTTVNNLIGVNAHR